jgi:two-component system, sensor histidine kinase LadS
VALRFLIVLLCSVFTYQSAFAIELGGRDNYRIEGKDVQVLVDKNRLISLSEVNQNSFPQYTSKSINFGLYSGRVWLKLSANSADSSQRILEFKNTQIDEIVLYTLKNKEWVKSETVGDIYPYKKRKNPHRYLHLSLPANGKFLIRIEGRGDPLNLKMSIFTKDGLAKRDYKRQIISGLYFSILFFIFLVNVFIFLFFRERRNLYLLGSLVAVIVFQVTLVGYGTQLFWGDYPYVQNRMTIWAGGMSMIMLSLFVQTFLNLKNISPRIHKLLNVTIVLLCLNLVLSLTGFTYFLQMAHVSVNLMSIGAIIIIFRASLLAYKHKFEAAGFIIVSKLAVIVSLAVFILDNFGVFTEYLFADISLEIGIAIQVIFITLAVISSFRLFKNESLLYLKEMSLIRIQRNENLKQKITERTVEIEEQKNQLEHSNKEIISSIEYAKRIQKALFPVEKVFLKNFENGFVYSKPKAIVSGDFYWQTEFEYKNDTGEIEKLNIICVGDSNDHGVPGALLGILYMRILESSVKHKENVSTAEIMKDLSAEMSFIFQQEEQFSQLKVSCSICIINKEKHTLEFSGASSSMLRYSDGELYETKGDSIFLEAGSKPMEFSAIKMQMKPTDRIFLFTDGIDKLLKNKKASLSLKTLLREESPLSIYEQKRLITKRIDRLIHQYDQIDDITIVALKC